MTRTINVSTATGSKQVAAHWVGQTIAVTVPTGHDPADGPNRGHWVITHVACGLSAGSLLCSKNQAITIAREWDARFACIDASDARNWPHAKAWGAVLQSINAPWQTTATAPADNGDGTDTAMLLAAQAGIPIQCEPVAKIQWRGRFWPAPTDAELDAWTMDSVCETPDGRTVEPDASDSWLRILRLV